MRSPEAMRGHEARLINVRSFTCAAVALALLVAACKEANAPERTLTITPGATELLIGATQQFSAQGGAGAVTWSSDDPAVATVGPQTGFVTAVGRGSTLIHAASGGVTAAVQVTVLAPPVLQLSAATIEFDMIAGAANPTARTVAVSNAGDGIIAGIAVGAIDWGAGEPQGWLVASVSGGTTPATLTLTPQAAALAAGTFTASVPVLANDVSNSPQRVAVTLRVQRPASIVVSRDVVPLQGIPGLPLTETVAVTNGGDVALTGLTHSISYTSGSNWLSTALTATTAPATLTITANTAALPPGAYDATVRVSSTVAGVAPVDIAVQLTVTPGPAIGFGAPTAEFSTAFGTNPPALSIDVVNTGGGSLTGLTVQSVSHQGQPNWLTAQLPGTTAPATLQLTANAQALPSGTYTATVLIASPVASNSPRPLTVNLTVGPAPNIVVDPTQLAFTQVADTTTSQDVSVTSSGVAIGGLDRAITYTAGGAQNWLSATFNTTTSPATLEVSANTTGLELGSYAANVRITSTTPGVAPRDLPVQLTVTTPPRIQLSTTVLTVFVAHGTNPAPQVVTITNSGGGALSGLSLGAISYSGSNALPWLTPTLSSTTAPGAMNLVITSASLASGSYSATVPVHADGASNSPVLLQVNLQVGPAPDMAVNPTSLSFSGWHNGSLPLEQGILITNVGGSTLSGLTASVQYHSGADWLTLSFLDDITTAPATLLVQPGTTALTPGVYTATITVSRTDGGLAPRTVAVSYDVLSYTTDIQTFFNAAGCAGSGCHTAAHPTLKMAGTAQANHGEVQPFALNGTLVCKIFGACSHVGAKFNGIPGFSAAVSAWIAAGAPF